MSWALCRDCGLCLIGDRDFDSHRVGNHAYTYSEGARMNPPRENGRRCLRLDELEVGGWYTNPAGRWGHPRRHGNPAPRERQGSARNASEAGAGRLRHIGRVARQRPAAA